VQAAIAVVRADAHVVRDLDLVVELHALLDHRVVQRAAVDGGVGADLDVVADAHAAISRIFTQRPLRRDAEPSPRSPRRMQDTSFPREQ
jgi:hypothetical protein